MADTANERPGLVATIAGRIVFFACIAMALQLIIVFVDYYFDDSQLASLIVERETGILATGIQYQDGSWEFRPPLGAEAYVPGSQTHLVRIRSDLGKPIFSNCLDLCVLHLLPEEVDPPDRWTRLLSSSKPIRVAGGRSMTIDGRRVVIEVAVLDENETAMWRALGHEFADHLAVPMSLQLVLILGGSLVSAYLALQPVKEAARQAGSIDPLDPEHKIDISRMPREIAELGAAVNRSLARIGGLMRDQRLYTTAVAHEIRTPLAMLQLELGQIDHPRARCMEHDIERLARFVGQITALGRLETIERKGFVPIDLAALGRGVVASIGPWVYEQGHSIAFADEGAANIHGDRGLLEDALVNLVTNAVNHTPAGTEIVLRAGPGPRVAVMDEAGTYRADRRGKLGDGFGLGLEIVRRIAAMHGGMLDIAVNPGRSTVATLIFSAVSRPPGRPLA